MNGGGLAGFSNVPVTRSFIICCVFLSILVGIKGYSNELGLSYQGVFKKLHIWKFAVSTFAFSSTPEMMYGVYLLYYFRVFERQIGSNKYSVFMLFSIMVSLLLEILALGLLKDPSWNILKSGPYGLIFSSFVPFYFDIPVTTRFRVFSLHFSNKSIIYLSGLQLLFSSWKRSILPGICGIVAGSLYRLNIFYIRRMKFPEFMVSFISRISSPSMGSTSRATTITSVIGGIVPPSNAGRQVEGNNMPVATMEPTEESIATLVSMGFDPNSARQALVHARNDINIATNILIESQSQ